MGRQGQILAIVLIGALVSTRAWSGGGAPEAVPAVSGAAGSSALAGGFRVSEARELIDLSVEMNEPSATAANPGWELAFDGTKEWGKPGIGPYNNAWKLWRKKGVSDTYAIVIRGTIQEARSVLQDLLSTSVPAGRVEILAGQGKGLSFAMAGTRGAETHLGFTYGLAVLLFQKDLGILHELVDKNLVPAGAKIYISGHSQGAAIATLVHAFLHYALHDPADRFHLRDKHYSLKSYVFAQPKPGNWQFAQDFAEIAGNAGLAYVINNTNDWVPQVPLTLQFVDEPFKDLLDEYRKVESKFKAELVDVAVMAGKRLRSELAGVTERRVRDRMREYMGNLDSRYFEHLAAGPEPAMASSINYVACGNLIAVRAGDGIDMTHDGWMTQHHAATYQKLVAALPGP